MIGIDVIIVNWNAGRLLLDCLKSIVDACHEGFELKRVVVVDNASTDGSLDGLSSLGLPLTIIQNNSNRGYAAACNQGTMGTGADYLLFLNPDTRLNKDTLGKPLAFMEQHNNRHVGITGVQLLDEKGQVSRTCARFPTPVRFYIHIIGLDRLSSRYFPSHIMNEWDHGQTKDVDHVIGAFFLTRRVVFEMLGGFDERFFVYLEDVDFSRRAYLNGWQTVYLADVQAFHKGGGTSEQVKAMRLYYSMKSRILYGYKHFSWIPATLILLGTLILEFAVRMFLAMGRCSITQVKETLRAYYYLWKVMPCYYLRRKHLIR